MQVFMHVQDVPRGHPDCLTGKTFVITGNLDSLGRDEAAELIKRHSGRVTGSVSGKTSFVLAGHDSGKKKVEKVRLLSPIMQACQVLLFHSALIQCTANCWGSVPAV